MRAFTEHHAAASGNTPGADPESSPSAAEAYRKAKEASQRAHRGGGADLLGITLLPVLALIPIRVFLMCLRKMLKSCHAAASVTEDTATHQKGQALAHVSHQTLPEVLS